MTTTDCDRTPCAAQALLRASAVRERCERLLDAADDLSHFKVHLDRLDAAADYVVETIRQNYPDLDIPFHARWRHFIIDGVDRWGQLASALNADREELARIRIDLVVTSVLLDAGAGPHWRYRDYLSGNVLARSEGLALASLNAFAVGFFSSNTILPYRADADGLQAITPKGLGDAFQVRDDNPIEGLDGRAALMNRLGVTIRKNKEGFPGESERIGNLLDAIVRDHGNSIDAAILLQIVLRAFGPIWPGRLKINGVSLGDTWRHPLVTTDDESSGFIPFHKLSQWLTYSLIEPLQDAGISVTNVDGLTGLAEYRNGGLFVDLGVLEVRDEVALQRPHAPEDALVVEWRALTVALLDRISVLVRDKLDRAAGDLPLASILEGGTWAAGRRIAAERREDGGPPLAIISDGSVF